MQTLDIILAANETKVFQIGGAYFEYIEGSAAVDINFTNAAGSRSKDLEMLGALPGYWVSGSFASFEVKNGPAPQIIRVMYGSGVGGSRRIQGAVRIVDSSVDKTSAGSQFEVAQAFAAQVGLGSLHAIWANGSAKKIAIRSLYITSATAGLVIVGSGTSAAGSWGGFAGAFQGVNKLIGSAAGSDARRNSGTTAGAQPTTGEIPGAAPLMGFTLAAGVTKQVPLLTPFVLTGTGVLYVSSAALNRDLSVEYEFEEITL